MSDKMCRNGHDTSIVGRNISDDRCTLCKRLSEAKYQKTTKGKIHSRENQWRKEGIINRDGSRFRQADYDRMLAEQNHKCGLCKEDKASFARILHVDHSHDTGFPRRLLCLQCNAAAAVREKLGDCVSMELYLLEYNSPKNTRQTIKSEDVLRTAK